MAKAIENFGKYILLERLAAGGMAEVYLAKSNGASGVSKFIAIKRILPQYSDNPEFIEMFKEEAKIAVNLNHSNVVSIFDFGIEKSQFFLVMEYVEGQNLRQVLNHLKKETKQFSVDQVVFIIKEVAAGLDHAHRCIDGTTGRPLNITHRDMSPQNVMVSFEGEVKIVDFGIAKAESQMEQTRAGTIKGKFGYMSPEQADGQSVDLRTDIFSIGILMWELLSGERLFTSSSEAGTLKKIRECQIPSLRKMNPSVPAELERICNKALAKDKSLRYQTSASLHRDLNRFLNTQYPEFSPHDFSVFMKSAFSQMFLDNRKKLVEYAKIQSTYDQENEKTDTDIDVAPNGKKAHPIHGNFDEDHLAVGLMDGDTSINGEGFVIDPRTKIRISLNDLQINQNGKKTTPPKSVLTNAQTSSKISFSSQPSINPRPSRENTRIQPKASSSSGGLSFLFFIILILGGAFLFKDNLKTVPFLKPYFAKIQPEEIDDDKFAFADPVKKEKFGHIDPASKQMYVATIESVPSGSHIFIDGVDTGMITPARRYIEADKEFKLSLRKDGYQYYERVDKVTSDAYILKATLQANPQMGYVSIEVMNGGKDPIITVNGQKLTEHPPIKLFAVPAGVPVKIEAYNPFAQLRASETITVGVSQKKQVNLILNTRQSNQTN